MSPLLLILGVRYISRYIVPICKRHYPKEGVHCVDEAAHFRRMGRYVTPNVEFINFVVGQRLQSITEVLKMQYKIYTTNYFSSVAKPCLIYVLMQLT